MVVKNQNGRGFAVLATLVIIPILLWLRSFGLEAVFASFGVFIASLGKAVALAGITLFCLNPVLSMRNKAVTALFGGIENTYKLHKHSGKISFLLITMHPFLLGIGRLLQGKDFTEIWNWASALLITGYFALLLLCGITAVSIYAHIKHQHWILIHRLYGWLIPLYFIHTLLAQSQMTKIASLFIYSFLIGIIGFSAFLYRSVLAKYLVKKHTYIIADVNNVSDNVVELTLKPTNIPMPFQAGQFEYVTFDAPGINSEPHPFSFSNANNGPYVRFAIKDLGDDTKNIQKIKPGSKVYLEGPYGNFSFRNINNHKQVWIAGGIGITPFLSMARSFSGKKHYDIRFFYGTESIAEAVFLHEFIDITRHLPENFDTKVVAKNLTGFVTIELLQSALGDIKEYDYLICGPPAMMSSLTSELIQAGVDAEAIHAENFSMHAT